MTALALLTILLLGWLLVVPTNPEGLNFLSIVSVDEIKLNFNSGHLQTGMTSTTKLLFFGYFAMQACWGWYSISRLHYLFHNFKHNKIFTNQNTKLIRHFGYALIIGVILTWLTFVSVFLLHSNTSPGFLGSISQLEVQLDADLMIKLIMIGMIFLSAWIMEIGCELYNDSEYTV